MKRHQLAAMAVADSDRNIDAYMSSVGGFLSSNQGVLFIRLVPRANRALDADKVIQELRPKFAQIPGLAGVLAESTPHFIRRHYFPKSIPVYASGGRDRQAVSRCAANDGWDAANQGASGRHERPVDPQSPGQYRNRQGQSREPRDFRRKNRIRARRRLLVGTDIDHLRAQQRVLGDHGTFAAVSVRSGESLIPVYPFVKRAACAAQDAGANHSRHRSGNG